MPSRLVAVAGALAAVAAAAPADASLPYIGCYHEVASPNSRWPLEIYALNWQKSPASPGACKTACDTMANPAPSLYGVDSYSCFCGYNTYENLRVVADSNCNETCNGDASSTCGRLTGDKRYLSMYGDAKALPMPGYLPGLKQDACYQVTDGDKFDGPSYKDDKGMTVNACAEFCVGKHDLKHIYLTNDNTCHCAASKVLSTDAGYLPACDVPCSGDPKQKCGGGKQDSSRQYSSYWVLA